ncbi:MAG: DUF2842 domain-containing protein [Novosphingobium sp.]|nr:DUF2842 domain-containing protein [Novosphingobium sp.]
MREQPTWRIPIGVLALVVGLALYGIAVAAWLPPLIGGWHAALQAPVYLLFGVLWLLPLRRFLIWMETGSWSPPERKD